MQLSGEYAFDAPRQVVWDFLMDPAVLEACLPGAGG
ncbi:MAG: SRPBCC domain-containing protein [Thermomicrobiales bacterium]